MSTVVSTRLPDLTHERLQRFARCLGKTPSETTALLVEESLRQQDFPYIEFRQTPLGRHAHLKNSTLAVWEVVRIAQGYALDPEKTAQHFQRPLPWVKSALLYADAYPEEINIAITDAGAVNETTLTRLLPQLEVQGQS
ncbi:transcriptional regulator [Synechocystis sp. LEGE 06083]|uniref:transcriptional regulator n=1 Tax=Synechocystis sp. LEGE 06083 TaxID=915336 RepID=UPI0018808294|nr:transcriptional regulator [Synechocystis sp. LEGE 06083]MBE9194349.1 transcriptional regulator [Synechocystis sp. LEGE 06083]